MSNLYIGDKLNTHTPNTQVSLKALATHTKLSINMASGFEKLKQKVNMAISIKKLKPEVSMDDKTVVRVSNQNKGRQIMAKSPAKKQVKRPTSKDLPGNGMVKKAGRAIEERKKKMRQLGV